MSKLEILPESEAWLESLNNELPYVCIEKENFQISQICARARTLLKSIEDTNLSAEQTLAMIKEMHALDRVATTWRDDPSWAYKTIRRPDTTQHPQLASRFPEFVQIHRDAWMAYEWNYHRNARIILHEHLLLCLDRLRILYSDRQENFQSTLCSFQQASVSVIQTLVDDVLSTVPQSLGDIDNEGKVLADLSKAPSCAGIGGYFLLWPIKVIKSTRSATAQQKLIAQGVFERIRECTGMKSALGEASSI